MAGRWFRSPKPMEFKECLLDAPEGSHKLEAREAYEVWNIRGGFEKAWKLGLLQVAIRMPIMLIRDDIDFKLQHWIGLHLVIPIVLAIGVLCYNARKMSTNYLIGLQLFAYAVVQIASVAFCMTMKTEIMKHRSFLCVVMFSQICQTFHIYVSPRVYWMAVVPWNTLIFLGFHWLVGFTQPLMFHQAFAQAVLSGYMYYTNDVSKRELFDAKVSVEREKALQEQERRRADSLNSAFRGMLDSVFDASCVCDESGLICSSTPQMDQVLLGSGGAAGGQALSAMELTEFAAGALERRRALQFLADVAQGHHVARRMQLTVVRRDGSGAERPTELQVSGIAMPSSGAGDSARVFVGVQLCGDVAPYEVSDASTSGSGPNLSECQNQKAMSQEPSDELASASQADGDLPGKQSSFHWGTPDDLISLPSCLSAVGGRSRCSAPPILGLSGRAAAAAWRAVKAGQCGSGGADCLPPNAVVRVEGRSVPMPLDSVQVGQKVLCYDELSRGLKYAEVAEKEKHAAKLEDWVVVTLEDGTEMQMTADHPVFPQVTSAAGGSVEIGRTLRAGDLTAEHSLGVLRLVATKVKDVRPLADLKADGRQTEERISVSMHQPERHSLFVSGAADTSRSMAVASSSLAVGGEMESRRYLLKNTFLAEEETPRAQRRTSSAPPRLRRASRDAPTPLWLSDQRTSLASERASERSFRSRVSQASVCASSLVSVFSQESAGDRVVLIGSGVADRNQVGHHYDETVKVSEVIQAKRMGLSSVGGLGHGGKWCSPCLMQHWHQEGKGKSEEPCKYGMLCSRCHECHTDADIKELKQIRRRMARAAQAVPTYKIAGA